MFMEYKNPVSVPNSFWEHFEWLAESIVGGQGNKSEVSGKMIKSSDLLLVRQTVHIVTDESEVHLVKGTVVKIETDDNDDITGIGGIENSEREYVDKLLKVSLNYKLKHMEI
jgi:hypothetical protein